VRVITKKISNSTVLCAVVVALVMLLATHLVLSQVRQEEIAKTAALQQNALKTFRELLRVKGSVFQVRDGQLLAGAYPLNGANELPDKVREITGVQYATIFLGDTRVATNILQESGPRALGTRLAGPAYDAIFRQGIPFQGEAFILGGSYFTAYDPIRDPHGKVIGALFVGSEKNDYLAVYNRLSFSIYAISGVLTCVLIASAYLLLPERKRSEDAIQKQLQFLQVIIDAIPTPVFYKNAQGKFLGFNSSYESMRGLSRDQMLGKTVHDLWHKDQADHYRQKDQELLEKSGVQSYESSVRYPDGTLRDTVINKAVFRGQDGGVGGVVGVILDVTELRRAEQERSTLEAQLHNSSMMESLMVQLGHDLKTPLTPLFAMLPLITRKVADPALERMLDICQSCVSQIQGLTDKALDLVRLSSKAVATELTPLRLSGVAEQSVKSCEALFSRRGIRCCNAIDPALTVQGAEAQLLLLFDNLLSNAARFAAENGVVRIAAVPRDGAVQVSVQDDGIGLEPGHKMLIFDEFFKADAARHDPGTQGLGLAISKSIALNHQGKIWAESPGRNQGTTIFFTLQPTERA
jgi:PAS domain S-box-containing protein